MIASIQQDSKGKKDPKKLKGQDEAKEQVRSIGGYFGLYDRFPPGKAWYNNTTVEGQVGYIRSTEPSANFYNKTP